MHPGNSLKSLCVYCGSNSGKYPQYRQAAESCGKTIASLGIRLVYGGGNVGLMGVIADAVLRERGEVTGVIPQHLVDRELAHRGLTELLIVGSMHERKDKMAELSDGFIAMPGGIGTLEETSEVFTWLQLGLHGKPIGILNTLGYYNPLLAFLDNMENSGFLSADHRKMLIVGTEAGDLIKAMNGFSPPDKGKWGDRKVELE